MTHEQYYLNQRNQKPIRNNRHPRKLILMRVYVGPIGPVLNGYNAFQFLVLHFFCNENEAAIR